MWQKSVVEPKTDCKLWKKTYFLKPKRERKPFPLPKGAVSQCSSYIDNQMQRMLLRWLAEVKTRYNFCTFILDKWQYKTCLEPVTKKLLKKTIHHVLNKRHFREKFSKTLHYTLRMSPVAGKLCIRQTHVDSSHSVVVIALHYELATIFKPFKWQLGSSLGR